MIKFTKYGAALLLGTFVSLAESADVESAVVEFRILSQLARTGEVGWVLASNPYWCDRKVDGLSDSSPDGWGDEFDERGIMKDWYWHRLGSGVSGNNLSWHQEKVAALTAKNPTNLVVFQNWYIQNKDYVTGPMAVGLFDSFPSFPQDSSASAMILEWLSSEPVRGFIVNSMFREPTEEEYQDYPMGDAENYHALARWHSINETFSCGYVFRLLEDVDLEKLPLALKEGERLLSVPSMRSPHREYASFKGSWEAYINRVEPYRGGKKIIWELTKKAGFPSGMALSGWEERRIQNLCANNSDNLTVFRNWYNQNKRNITSGMAHSLLTDEFHGFPKSTKASGMILEWFSSEPVRDYIRVAYFRDYTKDEYDDGSGPLWTAYINAEKAYERKEGFTCGYVFSLLAGVDLTNLPLVLAEGTKLLLANSPGQRTVLSEVDYGPFKDAWEGYVKGVISNI